MEKEWQGVALWKNQGKQIAGGEVLVEIVFL